MKRRVTYRPGKAQGALGAVFGVVFVLIGIFLVIPTFGPFGFLWTAMAIAATGMNIYQAFGKKYAGPEITIEEDPRQNLPSSPAPERHDHNPSTALDAKGRLEQLETLKTAGLISPDEYERKRREILEEL